MWICDFFFFQAEDGIRGAQESRGLGDVYKRQVELTGGEPLLQPNALALIDALVDLASRRALSAGPVSYTHLTLPTIHPV